eukprot:scaffold250218_cov36-Tisochrysis_lutea.AAC.1
MSCYIVVVGHATGPAPITYIHREILTDNGQRPAACLDRARHDATPWPTLANPFVQSLLPPGRQAD